MANMPKPQRHPARKKAPRAKSSMRVPIEIKEERASESAVAAKPIWWRPTTWLLGASLIGNAITYYGGLRQGINQMQTDLTAARTALSLAQAQISLQYVNLGNRVGIDRVTGRQFFQLAPILHNPNDVTVYAMIEHSSSNLAGKVSEPPQGQRDISEIYPGLDLVIYDDPIFVNLPKNDLSEGRVDTLIKYGTDRNKLDKVLRIKGGTAFESNSAAKRTKFMWLPDADSAKPIGMKSKKALYDPAAENPYSVVSNMIKDDEYPALENQQ